MGIDGSWEITVQTPMGPQSSKLEFKSDGSGLTGTQSGSGQQAEFASAGGRFGAVGRP